MFSTFLECVRRVIHYHKFVIVAAQLYMLYNYAIYGRNYLQHVVQFTVTRNLVETPDEGVNRNALGQLKNSNEQMFPIVLCIIIVSCIIVISV